MTDDKKALPKDTESDFSLPGRLEESNPEFFKTSPEYFETQPEKPKPTNRIIVIGVFAFILISAGSFSYYFLNQDEIDSKIIQSRITDPELKLAYQYGVGKYGSDHAHAAIAIFVNGIQVNFGLPQFQGTSDFIHFENNNPYQIHRHATNAPLEMLFSSFGMEITSDCVILNSDKLDETKYCEDQNKALVFYVNEEKYNSDISQYVIKHNDRILISFDDDKLIPKQLEYLKSLQIYDIPKRTPNYSDNNFSI